MGKGDNRLELGLGSIFLFFDAELRGTFALPFHLKGLAFDKDTVTNAVGGVGVVAYRYQADGGVLQEFRT